MSETAPKETSNTKAMIVVGLMFAMFLVPYFYVIYIYKTGELPTAKTNEKGVFFKPFINMADFQFTDTKEVDTSWSPDTVKGKWLILNFADKHCEQQCLKRLFNSEQAILALTQDQKRVAQVIVLDPELEINKDLQTIIGLRKYVHSVRNRSLIDSAREQIETEEKKQLPDISEYVAIANPNSQLLLWYRPEQSIPDILRDLKRLLKSSVASYPSETAKPEK